MRIKNLKPLGLSAVLVILALPLPIHAAQFEPAADQANAFLVESKEGSGEVSFSAATVVERIVGGRTSTVLSVPFFIENLSRKDLLMQTLDLWVVTPDGTVLSQPELSQNGVSVWRAEVNAKEHSELVAMFQLGSVPAFESFEFHWGGLLAYESRSGVVIYAALPGQGFMPAYAATDDALQQDAGPINEGEFVDGYYVAERSPYWGGL